MGVRITNRTQGTVSVPDPINYIFRPLEVRTYDYMEYDLVTNVAKIVELERKGYLFIENLDPAVGGYDSAWDGPRKFHLGVYQLWVDGTGALRIKSGDATSDMDGQVVGPGGLIPHGPTHMFTGSDPIPNIEVLEDLWNCTVTETILDVVYETAASTVARASAGSIATMPVVGIVTSKPTPTTALVARNGELTGFAGLVPDQPYFAGILPGTITLSPPGASGQVVQKVGYAKSTTTLVIEIEPYTVRA